MRKSDFIFRYRVRNWPAYNRALVRRGSITFWVDEEAVQGWRDSAAPGLLGGRRWTYFDTAIECVLMVRAVFHLSLRASQGFRGHESNWVRAVPGKGWKVVMRLYGPEEAWLNENWQPGEIEPVE